MKPSTLSLALSVTLGLAGGCGSPPPASVLSSPGVPVSVARSQADADAYYALGRYYQGQHRLEQAIDAYHKALLVNPDHADARNGLGASLLLNGQLEEAITQFEAGLRVKPASAALWNNLGYAHLLNGQAMLARIALERAIALDPADPRGQRNLALATTMLRPAVAEFSPVKPAQPIAVTISVLTRASIPENPPDIQPQPLAESIPAAVQPQQEADGAVQAVALGVVTVNLKDRRGQAEPAPVLQVAPRVMEVDMTGPANSSPDVSGQLAPPSTSAENMAENMEKPRTEGIVAGAADRPDTPVQEVVGYPVQAAAAEKGPEVANGAQPVLAIAAGETSKPAPSERAALPQQPVPVTAAPVVANPLPQGKPTASISPEPDAAPTTYAQENAPVVVEALAVVVPKVEQRALQAENVASSSRKEADSPSMALEIRNGNGVRHMALRTSRFLALQGYATQRLSNQPGFDVSVTRVQHLPGYRDQAQRLLAYLPKDAVLVQVPYLKTGIHVRVVLGRDMTGRPVGLAELSRIALDLEPSA